MKKIALILVTSFLIFSCESPNSLVSPNQNNQNFEYLGLTVNVSFGISKEEILNYENNSLSKSLAGSKLYAEPKSITSEVFYEILNKTIMNYPDFSKEKFSDVDFAKIRSAIPSLKNKEEAIEKKYLIFSIFETKASKEFKQALKDYTKIEKALKPNGYIDDQIANANLNATEEVVAQDHPIAANKVKIARDQAKSRIGNHDDDTALNAKLHFIFSAGAVKEIAHLTGNKWKALQWGKEFLTAHEYDLKPAPAYQRNFTYSSYMDLNNNLVARTYMYETVGQTWLGNANNIPSYDQIQAYANNSCSFNNKATIQDILQMSSQYNLDNLGHYLNAMDYHPTTRTKLVIKN